MSCNSQKISALRRQIPSFDCVPGCHDCCGPVTTSPEEMSRLPRKTAAEQDAAMEELNCVHLGPNGCTVYEARPVQCRTFPFWADMIGKKGWTAEAREICEGVGHGPVQPVAKVEALIREMQEADDR